VASGQFCSLFFYPFSLPTIIARSGMVDKLRLKLSEPELASLRRSAEVLWGTAFQIKD
jgi:malate/lactate dehydrogenase